MSKGLKTLGGNRAGARKRRRLWLAILSVATLGLAAFLILRAMDDALLYFRLPSDLQDDPIAIGQSFRLGGMVEDGSFDKLPDGISVRFAVTDGGASIPVRYTGILPDLFREGQGVIADGALDDQGTFIASRVLAKHDENYMPREVYEGLKERGLDNMGQYKAVSGAK